MALPVALQVYTVRDYAERDFAEAMKKVKEIGYDYELKLFQPMYR